MVVLLIVNVTVFPEFSGKFLADTTIQTLSQTQTTLKMATEWFMEPNSDDKSTGRADKTASASSAQSAKRPSKESRLASLTDAKAKLRSKLSSCKAALRECTFEIEYTVITSQSLKPISSTAMAGLIRNVNTLISACESKFVLLGAKESAPGSGTGSSDSDKSKASGSADDDVSSDNGEGSGAKDYEPLSTRTSLEVRLEHVKPQREIASGDPQVLETLLARVKEPVSHLLAQVDGAIHLVSSCLAYCYNIRKLPSGIVVPKGISIQEVDIRVDMFAEAIAFYDRIFHESLRKVAAAEVAHDEVR
jgi:hypothetical protein